MSGGTIMRWFAANAVGGEAKKALQTGRLGENSGVRSATPEVWGVFVQGFW